MLGPSAQRAAGYLLEASTSAVFERGAPVSSGQRSEQRGAVKGRRYVGSSPRSDTRGASVGPILEEGHSRAAYRPRQSEDERRGRSLRRGDSSAPGHTRQMSSPALVSEAPPSLLRCVLCSMVVHTLSYSLVGMIAFAVMDYPSLFLEPGLRDLMLPADDPRFAFGPAFQIVRGALYGVVVHQLRSVVLGARGGWAILWLVLLVVGIAGTYGPAPGSLEGIFFTTVPLHAHLRGLPEVLVQSLLFSWLLAQWLRHPEWRWVNVALVTLFVAACFVPILGSLAAVAPG
jgi:hypothetical protein